MMMPGVLPLGALRHRRIDLEFGEHRAGDHDVASITRKLQYPAGHRRRHLDHRLRGFHRHQRCIELDDIARFDKPLDDGRIGQALAEVGEDESFGLAHGRFL